MIYLTQLICVKLGKEKLFIEFESHVIPLMKVHGGVMIHRVRPTPENYIEGEYVKPYEIHFMSFQDEQSLTDYSSDPRRLQYMKMKENSIESIVLVKGIKQ
jgi:uncharacterized protein (DUF1330 family)